MDDRSPSSHCIVAVTAKRFAIPLAEILSDAKHGDHTHFELITVTVSLADGTSGTGYTYTGGKGGHAIKAMLDHDLAPFLIGQSAQDVEALYDAMQWHVHYVARGGIASFAISAVDIALWDLRCRLAHPRRVHPRGGDFTRQPPRKSSTCVSRYLETNARCLLSLRCLWLEGS